jgi:hypothetical protein
MGYKPYIAASRDRIVKLSQKRYVHESDRQPPMQSVAGHPKPERLSAQGIEENTHAEHATKV